MELTVIGVGNWMMGDDGVAPRIIERLAAAGAGAAAGGGGDGIEYLDGGVGGLRLLNWIEQAKRLLFVDAARFTVPVETCLRTRQVSKHNCEASSADRIGRGTQGAGMAPGDDDASPSEGAGMAPRQMRRGVRPGECRLFTGEQVADFARGEQLSLHETDLATVLRLARQFYRVPPTWLLAIQVESVEQREGLSRPVAARLERLAEIVGRLAGRLAKRPLE